MPCRQEAAAALVGSVGLFGIGASWGGYESLMILANPAAMRSATRWDPPGPTLRIHAGLAHSDDLIAELEAGFACLTEINSGHQAPPGHANRIVSPPSLRTRPKQTLTPPPTDPATN